MNDLVIRPARPEDVPAVVAMVHELAAFERAPEQCTLTAEQLTEALFPPRPALFGHVALADGVPLGFALWFLNFSTWAGVTEPLHHLATMIRPAGDAGCAPTP